MANARGNKHSQNHRYSDSEQEEFWDFSFENVADHDIPVTVDFILKTSGVKQLSFIGYSAGNTAMFAALTTKPEFYRERINCFVALAPAVKLDNCKSGIINMSVDNILVDQMIKMAGPELFLEPEVEGKLKKLFMKITNIDDAAIDRLSDDHPSTIHDLGKLIYLGHFPAGTSEKSLRHFFQLIKNKRFARYDYGARGKGGKVLP